MFPVRSRQGGIVLMEVAIANARIRELKFYDGKSKHVCEKQQLKKADGAASYNLNFQ
jgi:hypothetical protein